MADSYTKLLLHCDGADTSTTFTDASPSAHGNASVAGNAQVDTAQSVFGGASALFDGTGDYLYYASDADWDMGTADRTIDFRVRFNSVPGSGVGMEFISRFTTDQAGAWLIELRPPDFVVEWKAGTYVVKNFSWAPSADTWYHVAVVVTSGTLKVFIDGTQIGTDQTCSDSWSKAASDQLQIAHCDAGGGDMNGWIDELRVSVGIARWTTNFTPPTDAYNGATAVTGIMTTKTGYWGDL